MWQIRKNNRYFIIELCALIFLCFLRPLISDLEYNAYERNDITRFKESLEVRFVWGTFSFIFLSAYYWSFVKPMVLRNMHWVVFLSIPLFIAINHLFDYFVMDNTIAKISFISDEIREKSIKRILRKNLTIVFNYKLTYDYLPVIGLAYLIRAMKQYKLIQTLKEQQLLSELKYLKDRLHPHFFFNTLNNIYSLAVQQSPRTAPLVAGLSNLMRYMLYESDKPVVPLKKELEMLREYVALEKIRYGEQYDISFEVQGVQEKDTIPPLLLLPFVENAFKHGLQDAIDKAYIHIVICRVENQLILQIKNSVPAQKAVNTASGIGLATVRQRLQLIYGDDHVLNITEGADNYAIVLAIRMNT